MGNIGMAKKANFANVCTNLKESKSDDRFCRKLEGHGDNCRGMPHYV